MKKYNKFSFLIATLALMAIFAGCSTKSPVTEAKPEIDKKDLKGKILFYREIMDMAEAAFGPDRECLDHLKLLLEDYGKKNTLGRNFQVLSS